MGMNVFDFLRFVLFAVRIYDGKNFDFRLFVRLFGFAMCARFRGPCGMVRLKCLPFKNYVAVCVDGEMIGFCFFVVHIENRRIVCVFIRVFAGHITDTSVCTSVLYCLLCGRRKRVVRVVKNTCHCVLNFSAPLHCCALLVQMYEVF